MKKILFITKHLFWTVYAKIGWEHFSLGWVVLWQKYMADNPLPLRAISLAWQQHNGSVLPTFQQQQQLACLRQMVCLLCEYIALRCISNSFNSQNENWSLECALTAATRYTSALNGLLVLVRLLPLPAVLHVLATHQITLKFLLLNLLQDFIPCIFLYESHFCQTKCWRFFSDQPVNLALYIHDDLKEISR